MYCAALKDLYMQFHRELYIYVTFTFNDLFQTTSHALCHHFFKLRPEFWKDHSRSLLVAVFIHCLVGTPCCLQVQLFNCLTEIKLKKLEVSLLFNAPVPLAAVGPHNLILPPLCLIASWVFLGLEASP